MPERVAPLTSMLHSIELLSWKDVSLAPQGVLAFATSAKGPSVQSSRKAKVHVQIYSSNMHLDPEYIDALQRARYDGRFLPILSSELDSIAYHELAPQSQYTRHLGHRLYLPRNAAHLRLEGGPYQRSSAPEPMERHV